MLYARSDWLLKLRVVCAIHLRAKKNDLHLQLFKVTFFDEKFGQCFKIMLTEVKLTTNPISVIFTLTMRSRSTEVSAAQNVVAKPLPTKLNG